MSSTSKTDVQREWRPVTTLDSDLARVYTHVHPLVVLSGFLLQFRAIVDNPVSVLSSTLLPLGTLQVLYVVLCLPPVGSSASNRSSGTKPTAGRKSQPVEAAVYKRITVSSLYQTIQGQT